jgi:stage III sporulation protein SpoIIIAA
MANPYVVGPPVIGEKYYRSREKIQQVLTDSQQLFLIADARRIGKTSFLRELERVADTEKFEFQPDRCTPRHA